jgi:hypothetical protein
VRVWLPERVEGDQLDQQFITRIGTETVLVVADEDLTKRGALGLYGSNLVAWSQIRLIPVIRFSRNLLTVPRQPNPFELRLERHIAIDDEAAATRIAAIHRGFRDLGLSITANRQDLRAVRSPAGVLAHLLGSHSAESDFALYGLRLGLESGALVERVTSGLSADRGPTDEEKEALLVYMLGHLLVNFVLAYPGPILSRRALASYMAIDVSVIETVEEAFAPARYDGPFSDIDLFYWLSGVGQNGGFYCPFTQRTVCVLPECSAGTSSWIPQGARLCRIERSYYDEWSPMFAI